MENRFCDPGKHKLACSSAGKAPSLTELEEKQPKLIVLESLPCRHNVLPEEIKLRLTETTEGE